MAEARQRIDKWLWFARFAKSRTLAAGLVSAGQVRINKVKAGKPSQDVQAGDILTLALHGRVQVLRVRQCGARRGPASEARLLYETIETSDDPAAAKNAAQ
jgi:ribosome-associated heat shock protein Hsp15